jgi:hypothetical protein
MGPSKCPHGCSRRWKISGRGGLVPPPPQQEEEEKEGGVVSHNKVQRWEGVIVVAVPVEEERLLCNLDPRLVAGSMVVVAVMMMTLSTFHNTDVTSIYQIGFL